MISQMRVKDLTIPYNSLSQYYRMIISKGDFVPFAKLIIYQYKQFVLNLSYLFGSFMIFISIIFILHDDCN